MSNKRFSKTTVLEFIESRTEQLKQQHRLNTGNGTAQLRGRDIDTAVAYGEFRSLLDLKSYIEDGWWP